MSLSVHDRRGFLFALAATAAGPALAQPAASPRSAGPPSPALIEDLVVANRILADQGVVDGFGHISARHDKNPERFLISRNLAPGQVTVQTTHVFAGAKKVSILQGYEKSLGIPRLDQSVVWGNFWFFTRPIFSLLAWFYSAVGNFGLSILLLTVTVRTLFFPLANKSYESMTKMKKLQPKMEEIKKKNDKDPAKQQQEIMELYKREKVNPLAGCAPLLLQIPVFYSLYKVLYVTIEMRHAPFFGWLRDLSAPDPTTILNLFGLIPWDPTTTPVIGTILGTTLHVGVLPLIYGVTMWLTTAMSPPPSTDPTQKLIFQFFPVIFTFTLARSPAGLLLYWSFSNCLTILQQYVIMRRFGVDNPIDVIIARVTGKSRPAKA